MPLKGVICNDLAAVAQLKGRPSDSVEIVQVYAQRGEPVTDAGIELQPGEIYMSGMRRIESPS